MIFDVVFSKIKHLKDEDLEKFKRIILTYLERVKERVPHQEYLNKIINEISNIKIVTIRDVEQIYVKLQELSRESSINKNIRINGKNIISANPEVLCKEEINEFLKEIGGKK